MTGQINDSFFYNNKSYVISAIQYPTGFFEIQQLGITPEPESSACWRGYVANFSLWQEKLVLKDLRTNNGNDGSFPPAINGVMPEVKRREGLTEYYQQWQNWHYHDVNLVIPYTGAILIADGFIYEHYIHMGFQSPLSYRKVIELRFDGGSFMEETDLSETAAYLREVRRIETCDEQIARLPEWIEECFDLSYDVKWPSGEDA